MLRNTISRGATSHRPDQIGISHLALRRAAVLAGAALLTLLGSAASAHDAIISTNPPDGTQVDVVPGQIELLFNNVPLSVGAAVEVTGPDGRVVSTDPPQVVDTTVIQTVASDLPVGAYRVLWRVTSSDGHPLSGEFGFTATTGAVPVPEPAPEPSPTSAPTASSDAAVTPTPTTLAPDADTQGTTAGQGVGKSQGVRTGVGLGVAAVLVAAIAVATRRLRRPSD